MQHILKVKANATGRDFVCGDIHGCFDELISKLDKNNFSKVEDRLFSVGDICDRGPKNIECLNLLWEPWFFPVLGNHELMASSWILESVNSQLFYVNGGTWWLSLSENEQKEVVDLFKTKIGTGANPLLPYIILIEKEGYEPVMVCHAQPPVKNHQQLVDRNYTLSPLQQEVVVWGRSKIQSKDSTWIDGFSQIFCGHTPQRCPVTLGNVFFIDLGCFHTGELHVEEIVW